MYLIMRRTSSMKKLISMAFALTIAAAMALVTTSCAEEENIVNSNAPATGGVTVTVGASIADDATTRSEVVESTDANGKKRTLKFTAGDKLFVMKKVSNNDVANYVGGMLDMVGEPSADGKSATFTGEVMGYGIGNFPAFTYEVGANPLAGTEATLVHAAMGEDDYSIADDGSFDFIYPYAANVETLMTRGLRVTGSYQNGGYSLNSVYPIINCSLSGLAPSTEYKATLRYPANIGYNQKGYGIFTTNASGAGTVAFDAYDSGTQDWEIEISLYNSGTTVGTIDLGNRELTTKVYNVRRQFVDLANVTTTDTNGKLFYAAQNGDIISGNFGGSEGYITIADGATVTLDLEGIQAPYQCDHAPIHCLGDANIILADGMEAHVNAGLNSNYPAVFVPEGKTMTISGTGELIADAGNSYGAGIGGGMNITGGNIVIAGGIISAYGSYSSAAIGSSSSSSCGNITISGGAIKEARYQDVGDSYGAGIGSGSYGSCGTITISGGQIGGKIGGWSYDGAVGSQYAAGIGSGQGGSCGTITIGADITYVRVSSNSNSYHLIGGEWPNSCDVYFGNFKVYDKETCAWYNSSTGTYKNYFFPFDGNYGGLKFESGGGYWILTPVTTNP